MDPKEGARGVREHKTNVGDVIKILRPNDVLCGRGSGPNDHPGNVAFRELILSRKAEYLSTSARAEKAKIASEIVDHVQKVLDPAGRFLKKMGPAELLEKGFKEGQDVWAVVDQNTALEKAKQALRQNRDKPLVEEELKKKQAERHEENAKLTQQASASLKSNSAETAATATTVTGSSTTRKSIVSTASSLSSGGGGQARRMEDSNMLCGSDSPTAGAGTSGSAASTQHGDVDPCAAASLDDPLAPYPYDDIDPGAVVGYPSHQRGAKPGRGGDDVTQSLRVSDLVTDFHRLGPGDCDVAGEHKTGGTVVAQEQFPYAFGGAGQGSSNVTMNSVFSGVSESDILAANIDPIPVGGSDAAEIGGPMSSGTLDLVQQLTQSSGEGPDDGNATNEQNNRQKSFQQQQYQRHPGHQPGAHSYVQQYYYRLDHSSMLASNRSEIMKSDMTTSLSLTELTKEPSGRNVAAYRQSVAAGGTGMQGIAEGEAGDEGSVNDEDGAASGEPMSGASAAAGSRSGSSGKISGSSGSGMAVSLASSGDKKPQALAVAPRPVELILKDPDNLTFGASSSSMIKAVFDTSSGSNFSKMSGILVSGEDDLKPPAAAESEGKANT